METTGFAPGIRGPEINQVVSFSVLPVFQFFQGNG
jgi:hypothetical protein